jgi:hypothetical protein
MLVSLHAKYLLLLSDINEIECFRQILDNCCNIKFHENSSIGAALFRADKHDKLIVAFLNFASAPEKEQARL